MKHPAHSPDVAPSDYYLLADFKKFLRGKKFTEVEQLIGSIKRFYDEIKTPHSFLMDLPLCVLAGNVLLMLNGHTLNKCG
jgi:hypothetical protein